MKNLEEIKQLLKEQQELLYNRFRVSEMRIFGSYARAEQTIHSDVDILISYHHPPTLWMLGELKVYLSEVLGLKVDIVTEKGLKPKIKKRVLAEAVKI